MFSNQLHSIRKAQGNGYQSVKRLLLVCDTQLAPNVWTRNRQSQLVLWNIKLCCCPTGTVLHRSFRSFRICSPSPRQKNSSQKERELHIRNLAWQHLVPTHSSFHQDVQKYVLDRCSAYTCQMSVTVVESCETLAPFQDRKSDPAEKRWPVWSHPNMSSHRGALEMRVLLCEHSPMITPSWVPDVVTFAPRAENIQMGSKNTQMESCGNSSGPAQRCH